MHRHSTHVHLPEGDEALRRLLNVLEGLAEALAGGGWRRDEDWAALLAAPDTRHDPHVLLLLVRAVVGSDLESIWFERLDDETARLTWSGCHTMPDALAALLEAFGVRILIGV